MSINFFIVLFLGLYYTHAFLTCALYQANHLRSYRISFSFTSITRYYYICTLLSKNSSQLAVYISFFLFLFLLLPMAAFVAIFYLLLLLQLCAGHKE